MMRFILVYLKCFQNCFYSRELDRDLPENYLKPAHFFDIWHMIKVEISLKLYFKFIGFQAVNKDLWRASKLKSCLG